MANKLLEKFNFKKITSLEILVFVLFVIYLVFQVQTPAFLMPYIGSPLGIAIVLLVTLTVFFYTNPVLGILSLFVAYELIRRSTTLVMAAPGSKVVTVKYTPTQIRKDIEMAAMNPPREMTVEEEVITQMAPIGVSAPISYMTTTFKPVSENIHHATST